MSFGLRQFGNCLFSAIAFHFLSTSIVFGGEQTLPTEHHEESAFRIDELVRNSYLHVAETYKTSSNSEFEVQMAKTTYPDNFSLASAIADKLLFEFPVGSDLAVVSMALQNDAEACINASQRGEEKAVQCALIIHTKISDELLRERKSETFRPPEEGITLRSRFLVVITHSNGTVSNYHVAPRLF